MTTSAIFYVYAYFRPDGRPCYIGKGKGNRIAHRGKAGRNIHFIRIRDQAKAAGVEMPCIKLIEGLTADEALLLERFFIAAIGREIDGGPLVNLSIGGAAGPVGYCWTPEQKEAHSKRMRDRVMPPDWRENISAALKDKPKSPEHAAAVGAAQKGKTWSPSSEHIEHLRRLAATKPHKNHKHSEETKEIIRRAALRQFASSAARKAVQTSPLWADLNSARYHQPVAA